MKLYLAGPEVFLEDAREIGRRKQALCAAYGFTGLYPLDPAPEAGDRRGSAAIFAANLGLMRQADALIANLTPFRGLSGDVGTAFEVGFCAALGKPVMAYSAVPGLLKERALQQIGPAAGAPAPTLMADGFHVEDFGHFDNLMLAEAVAACGLAVVTADAAPADPLRDLVTFERALAVLAATVGMASAIPATRPAAGGAARIPAEEGSHG